MPETLKKETVRKAAEKLRQISQQISKVYEELGGADVWREAHSLAHERQKLISPSEQEAVFDLSRGMETTFKAAEDAAGAAMFLKSIVEKPHLCVALFAFDEARARKKR